MDELLVMGEFYSVRFYEHFNSGRIDALCYTCANRIGVLTSWGIIEEDEDSIDLLFETECDRCGKQQSIVAHDGNPMHHHSWHTEADEVSSLQR